MASPMAKAGVIGAVLAVATLAVLVFAMLGAFRETCEVCITFHGRTECRVASGRTREEALRTATDNACALLAGGMTQVVECTNTRPSRSLCQE